MRLVHLGDRVGQLAPSPIFKPVDTAALPGDHRAIPLDHPGHLLALVRVNNKDDFVVMHADSLLMDVSQVDVDWARPLLQWSVTDGLIRLRG